MQPSQDHSPWPKRLMISGIIIGFLGIILLSFIFDDLDDYYDPRETSEHSVNGETNTLTLDSGCWVVNVEGDDDDYTVTVRFLENGTAGEKVSSDCRTDFQPSTADVEFSTVTKVDISEKTDVIVTIECKQEGACDNPILFTNGDDVILEMISDVGLWSAFGACCLGAILLPMGWILVTINKNKNNSVVFTPEQIQDSMFEHSNDPNNFNQEIMTTDQLYQLVRGEVPEQNSPKQNVPSPFANQDTRPSAVKQAKSSGSIYSASTHTPENPPTDDSWKSWDEM